MHGDSASEYGLVYRIRTVIELETMVAHKSKPLSRTIIKSYSNPPLKLAFSSISTTKWPQEY